MRFKSNHLLLCKGYNSKNMTIFLVFIFYISFLNIISTKRILTPIPWQAEAGQATFVKTDPTDVYTDDRYFVTFDIPLLILSINGQPYRAILGFRQLDQMFSSENANLPRTQVSANPLGNTATNTNFQVSFYTQQQNLMFNIRINYLIIGNYLTSNGLVVTRQLIMQSPDLTCGTVPGTATPLSRNYVRNLGGDSMPSTNYRIYLSIAGVSLHSASSVQLSYPVFPPAIPPSVIPPPPYLVYYTAPNVGVKSRLQISLLSNTLTTVTIKMTVQNMQVKFMSMYFYAVHNDMFVDSSAKDTVFIQYTKTITSALPVYPFQDTISHKVITNNFFIGLNGFGGNAWSFKFSQTTPISDFILNGQLFNTADYLNVVGLIMYGYTNNCLTYRNCLACYMPPNYQCLECQKNFILVGPPNTDFCCQCPAPFKLVSGICDNIPNGCGVAVRLPDDSIECHLCDIAGHYILSTTVYNQCDCMSGYYMDGNGVCQDICGDGKLLLTDCDDGNLIFGDGCSNTCTFQTGFSCDTTVEPTKCKSLTNLIYKIQQILKKEQTNSAIMKLKLKYVQSYPFPVLKNQFNPISINVILKLIISQSPYNEMLIQQFKIIEIDSNNNIFIQFNYNMTVQNLQAQLYLNYQNTNYFNYVQKLQFTMKGDNQTLKFDDKIFLFQILQYIMMAFALITILLLLIGSITSKFIGVECIISQQLIFLSQVLIYDNNKFPVGFLFLAGFQYTTGYNHIVQLSDYSPKTQVTKKMMHIKRQKMIIESYNINFGILLIVFICLLASFIYKRKQQKLIQQEKQKRTAQQKLQKKKKNKIKQVPFYRKFNDLMFNISNQVVFWLYLPLLSSIAASQLIQNYTLTQRPTGAQSIIQTRGGQLIAIFSSFIIFFVALGNFVNLWLTNQTNSQLHQRAQQMKYKQWLFIYLNIIGSLIFFGNQLNLFYIYDSAIILLLQIIHLIVIIYLKPYKQALRIHTIGLILNACVYLAFLIIINAINYLDDLGHNPIVFIGFGIIGVCAISIVVTIIRLYYQIKYGRQLQQKIQQERLRRQQQQKDRLQALRKAQRDKLQNQALGKLSLRQRLRQKNQYLYQNQVKQDQKKQLMTWLENRDLIDQKVKDKQYFKRFPQKPLDWLKQNDKQKYNLKVQQINQHLHKQSIQKMAKQQDENFIEVTQKLRKQVKSMKKTKESQLKKHTKKMNHDPTYAMNIMRHQQNKFFNLAYHVKK